MARILHVLTSPRAEGTPRLVLDWLSETGHEQGVAFLTGEPADLTVEFQRTGCWLRMGDVLPPGPKKFLRMAGAARRWTREFSPDLVIVWPTGFSHWVFLGVRAAGSRAALLSHGGNPPAARWLQRYGMTWMCLWLTALCGGRLVACSRYVQGLFAGIPLVPASRVGFAYNAIRAGEISRRAEGARARRTPGGPPRIIMVATLERHKDHATLLRAVRLLRDRRVELEIWLAGAGSLEASLRALARELALDDTVTFLGARRDVPELLGQCDAFVLSTTPQEGFGLVLCEALAAGLPVIATAVEPVREVLQDGRWGTLVAPGDAAALARALAAVVRTEERGEKVVAARRAFAAAFNPRRMMDDYLSEAFPVRS